MLKVVWSHCYFCKFGIGGGGRRGGAQALLPVPPPLLSPAHTALSRDAARRGLVGLLLGWGLAAPASRPAPLAFHSTSGRPAGARRLAHTRVCVQRGSAPAQAAHPFDFRSRRPKGGAASKCMHAPSPGPRSPRGNDPSAGSPTETLLRLHLPLDGKI